MKITLIQKSYKNLSLEDAVNDIELASDQGADIICFPELFLTPYFCVEQNTENFNLAVNIPGKETELLSIAAKNNNCIIIASLFEYCMEGVYFNTSVIIDENGKLLGKYRKNHIPQDPSFEEKFYFTPGDSGYPVFETSKGKIGILICWDQWFPEAARTLALKGADIIFVPTAIGWLPEEKEELGEDQLNSWKNIQKGHAVANSVYYCCPNRADQNGPIEFWGNSFGVDPFGKELYSDGADETVTELEIDLGQIEEARKIWPFFRDRRTDIYAGIEKSWL